MLPQYSGGLGILAGDHLKAASDLGVPIVGVGLLYRHGYFKQSLSREGWQQEHYPVLDPDELPLSLLREADGTRATISIEMPGGPDLLARIWVAQVGRVPLLLLDSDVEGNPDDYRDVTDRLYGGNTEHRLRQEMLLGVGGVRALRAYCRHHRPPGARGVPHQRGPRRLPRPGADPRADRRRGRPEARLRRPPSRSPARRPSSPRTRRSRPASTGSRASWSSSTSATTAPTAGVPVEQVLALGAEDYDGGDPSVFNMAVMGFRLAQRANGVSQLHGDVSREMFDGLWPAFDEAEVPIGSITNGVHAPTWVAREVIELAAGRGADPDADDVDAFSAAVDEVAGHRRSGRSSASCASGWSHDARRRLRSPGSSAASPRPSSAGSTSALDPDVLTIGFARRVPSYKRLTLMLRDPERLKRLLLHPERPVQLIIAGKSHPADDGGKKLIQEIVRFADDPEVRHRIVFLPNYDIAMAQPLYPGCDVWLNNPLRPYEACGTSGMKAALNGGLNLSILDGWWDEWYDGNNGWAIPSADGVDDPDRRDDLEADALYDLIENEVAPRFYDLDARRRARAAGWRWSGTP